MSIASDVSRPVPASATVAPRRAAVVGAPPRVDVWPRLAVLAAGALGVGFFALTAWMAFTRHDTFNTGRLDLEIYTQVVWNTAAGRPFETTLLKTNLSHLAEHMALVLVPISWLYRVVPDPKLLIGIQQLGLAFIGWPLFLWARRALGAPAQALVVVACFYATPALAGIALDDFHAVALTALPLAVGLGLVLAGRPGVGALVALVALPIEEESALFLIGLGALLVLRRERRLGLLVGGLAAAWLAVAVFVVMPRFHDGRTIEAAGGNRTLGHFAELRTDPSRFLGRVVGERGFDAGRWLVLPTAGLGLLAPQSLLVAAPSFAALALQDRDDTFGRHWAAPLLVAVWFATVAGLARLPAGTPRRAGLAALVVGTALGYRLVSPLPGGALFDGEALEHDDRTALLARAVERVPPEGSVIASANVVAHLANRPQAYVFPIDSHYADGIVWDKKRPNFFVLDLADNLTNRATVSERLNPLVGEQRPYHVWSAGRKVLVLSDRVSEPSVPVNAAYGNRLRLVGYDVEDADGTRLVMHWERYNQARGRYDRELTVFDGAGNRVLYQEDMPLSATHGSNKWDLGQRILDEVALPEGRGPLRVRVAWVAQDKRTPVLLADRSEALEFVVQPYR